MKLNEKALEAAREGARASARERGWRGNHAEAWPIDKDAVAAVHAYFVSLSEQEVVLVDVREVVETMRQRIASGTPQQMADFIEARFKDTK